MSTKKTGFGGPMVPPQIQGGQQTEKAHNVAAPHARGVENLKAELPASGLKGTASPLAGLIASGLEALAKAEGWEGQQSALGLLVNAMMKANPKPEVQQSIGRVDFGSMLQRLAPTREEAVEVEEDAEKLAALAALIVNPDQGRKKQKNKRQHEEDEDEAPDEMQLKRDVEEVRDALNYVLADPSETREQHVTALIENLGWVANQLGRVDWQTKRAATGGSGDAKEGSARPVEQNASVVRIDGLVGMMKIVLKYVRKGRKEH